MIKQKGFTIIELLVVIAIIGILGAIGTVMFQGHIKSTKETVARNHLKNIYLAQAEYYADNNTYYSSGSNCGDHSQVIDTNLFSGDNVLREDKNFYYCVIGANNNTEYKACTVNKVDNSVRFYINHKNENGPDLQNICL